MADRERMTLTTVFEEIENGWLMVRLEEFPEVVTAAPTKDEARVLILDALKEYLAACLEEGRAPVFKEPASASPS
jgi:predicted RNase H-like HicB family nuclease